MTDSSGNLTDEFSAMPVGALGLIGMRGCEDILTEVDDYISDWRRDDIYGIPQALSGGYMRDSYKIDCCCPRFGTGEAKAVIKQSVRGYDLFIIADMFNHGVTYGMYGQTVPMSPDDHYQDLKRIIAAAGGKARRITVIMTMLYEGRQDKRAGRESLDCAMMLQELANIGVDNIITFDAHNASVQNAIPFSGFENIQPTYQMIKAMVNNIPDLEIDRAHMMIVSPDPGAMSRCIYYSSVLGLELGMFYKQRDYGRIVNGKNPIVAHQFLGDSVEGKDVVIIDDLIASGESVIDVATQMKERHARRIFICAAFGQFTEGLANFDRAYKAGIVDRVFTTNLIYRTPDLKSRPWYCEVDMAKFIAHIINVLNHDMSISHLLSPAQRIQTLLDRKRQGKLEYQDKSSEA